MGELNKAMLRADLGDDPLLLSWVEAWFTPRRAACFEQLVAEADESAFSLRQWVEALVHLDRWLTCRSLEACLEDQIGYVGCAAAAASAAPGFQSLRDLVEDMLLDYGFDRARPQASGGTMET